MVKRNRKAHRGFEPVPPPLIRGVRVGVLLAIALLLTACGAGEGKKATADAKQCTDRMLAGIEGDHGPMVRSYVQRTYCDRFAKRGWVYEDGMLSIEAHLWLMHGMRATNRAMEVRR